MTEGKITGTIKREDKKKNPAHILVFKDDELVKHMKTDKSDYTIDGLEAGEKYHLLFGCFDCGFEMSDEVVAV
jgi:hypothetical protein